MGGYLLHSVGKKNLNLDGMLPFKWDFRAKIQKIWKVGVQVVLKWWKCSVLTIISLYGCIIHAFDKWIFELLVCIGKHAMIDYLHRQSGIRRYIWNYMKLCNGDTMVMKYMKYKVLHYGIRIFTLTVVILQTCMN